MYVDLRSTCLIILAPHVLSGFVNIQKGSHVSHNGSSALRESAAKPKGQTVPSAFNGEGLDWKKRPVGGVFFQLCLELLTQQSKNNILQGRWNSNDSLMMIHGCNNSGG